MIDESYNQYPDYDAINSAWKANDYDRLREVLGELLEATELALHKIEQTLDGQYTDGAALRATLGPLRAAIARAAAQPT